MEFRGWVVLLVLSMGGTGFADDKRKIEELEEKINKLAGIMARKTKADNPWSIGGYGELHYNHHEPEDGPTKKELDFHRFVLFFGYRFNDKISFVSELEVEHAISGEGQNGEVEVEQAYVSYLFSDAAMMKMGLQLVPVGIMNETHEPPTFYGVERNSVEKLILPSTWWASGISLKKRFNSTLSLEGFIHEGLLISDTFSIRGGRQKSSKSKMDSPASTVKIASGFGNGLTFQASFQYQDDFSQGQAWGGDLLLLTGNLRYQRAGFQLIGLYAHWSLGGKSASEAGKDLQTGGYLEANYKFNPKFGVYSRHNQWSTHRGIREEKLEAGVNYWLHRGVVCKFDVFSHEFEETKTEGFNLGFGYHF